MSECNTSKVIQKHNREAAESEAAERLARMIQELLSVQETVAFAVCGGTSVAGVFDRLAKHDLEWSRVHVFMADERFVPLGDAESNFGIVQQHLIDPRACSVQEENHPDWDETKCLPAANVHPFIADDGVAAYERELLSVREHFDIILLSAGEDGHVGAIYPRHHSFDNDARLFIEMEDSPKAPPHRMSLSREHVKKAHSVMVLFFGEGKRAALRNYSHAAERDCPARLAGYAEHTYAITDLG